MVVQGQDETPSFANIPIVTGRGAQTTPTFLSWLSISNIATALFAIAALAGYLYVAGLFNLSRELTDREVYHLDPATAWHAATLAPVPLVARQGLNVLLSGGQLYLVFWSASIALATIVMGAPSFSSVLKGITVNFVTNLLLPRLAKKNLGTRTLSIAIITVATILVALTFRLFIVIVALLLIGVVFVYMIALSGIAWIRARVLKRIQAIRPITRQNIFDMVTLSIPALVLVLYT